MQIIRNWLSRPFNFSTGVILYNTFGTNQPFKDLLAMGETPFARNQLLEELTGIAEGTIALPVEPVNQAVDEMPAGDDEILKALESEWQPVYQKMNLLRHRLDKYGPDNSDNAIAYRKPIAAEIKQLEKQCMGIWKKRDYYKKHGKLPFVQENNLEIPVDPVELANLITNTQRYIRRYRLKMEKHPGVPKYAQLYMDYKNQFKTLTGNDYEEKS